jgi:hypothetical protein
VGLLIDPEVRDGRPVGGWLTGSPEFLARHGLDGKSDNADNGDAR